MDYTSISAVSGELAEKIALPRGAEVTLDELRVIDVPYVDFEGREQRGRLICGKSAAAELCAIFAELFAARYPIEKIRFAHEYGGDDDFIMADNVSSCFNYRTVANTNILSAHARGLAVDINPLYNPYIQNGVIMPANAAPYADREVDFPHKITHDDVCYKTFIKRGWKWGGDWKNDKDYQHFYKK